MKMMMMMMMMTKTNDETERERERENQTRTTKNQTKTKHKQTQFEIITMQKYSKQNEECNRLYTINMCMDFVSFCMIYLLLLRIFSFRLLVTNRRELLR